MTNSPSAVYQSGSQSPGKASGEKQRRPEEALQPIDRAADDRPESTPDALRLTARQVAVLKSLTNGASIIEAAAMGHVSRSSVHRWFANHPAFRAAYHRWRESTRLNAQARLYALQDTAIDVLTWHLEEKQDGRLAALLLSRLGALAPADPGPVEPVLAQKQIEFDRRQLNLELAERSSKLHHNECFVNSEHKIPAPVPEDDPHAAGTNAGRVPSADDAARPPGCGAK